RDNKKHIGFTFSERSAEPEVTCCCLLNSSCTGGEDQRFFGVVTAVSFITVCVVAVVTRLLYRRQFQRSDPASPKDKQQRSTEEPAFRTELHLHHAMRDSIKEYYI
uniref:Uncharacterized protein n=1 Tax=Neogobius melanostomus TaxID=47308 RepID=A0A8C6V1C7_9GOBI